MKKTAWKLFLCVLPAIANAQYNGTGAVTQGVGTTTVSALYTCTGGRVTNVGTIQAQDGSVWTVPAEQHFQDATFPASSDLYNSCTGALHATTADAVNALSGNDIVTVDSGAPVYTAYIFADNYFEMYVNGVPVGKDNVPYTPFNSSIVRFRAFRPFTIAMALVDWEESLGLGYENNSGFAYYAGDGGMAMMLKDASNQVVAITDSQWRAQTFYTAPITDLTCPVESGLQRLSNACAAPPTNNGASHYGLHWSRPLGWNTTSFNDADFPYAVTYSNTTVGVNNKPAYTNFPDLFDDPQYDAQFIWSSNLVLDNEVLVRYTVPAATGIDQQGNLDRSINVYPNPSGQSVRIAFSGEWNGRAINKLTIRNVEGKTVYETEDILSPISVESLADGVYLLQAETSDGVYSTRFTVEKP